MTPEIVKLLSGNAFLSFNRWVEPNLFGNCSPVFVATFLLEGGEVEAFCKPYPVKQGASKGMFNEISGYIATAVQELPQPQRAFVTRIPIKDILDFAKKCPKRAYGWMYERKEITVFCTTAIPAANFVISGHEQDLMDDIAQWELLDEAVGLDEIIANTDRHTKNLIRTGAQQYALIDNGKLITETDILGDWQLAELDNGKNYNNHLSEILKISEHNRCFLRVQALQKIPPAALDELKFWAGLLLSPEEKERFIDFYLSREKNIPCLIKNRFRLI